MSTSNVTSSVQPAVSHRAIRLWDPLARLGRARHVAWLFLAANLVILQWPLVRANVTMGTDRYILPDFYQDYASCKNLFQGLPIYSEHELTTRVYIPFQPVARNLVVHVNAHPPTSVLLALPFVWLEFETAFFATNLLSLAAVAWSLRIVIRELGVAFGPTCYAPATALAATCYPVIEHLLQGQLGSYISVLLIGAWACERNGRPRLAGLLIGLAATIKFFPLFLLSFFAWRRRWDVLTAGLASAALSTVVTACVLGKRGLRRLLFRRPAPGRLVPRRMAQHINPRLLQQAFRPATQSSGQPVVADPGRGTEQESDDLGLGCNQHRPRRFVSMARISAQGPEGAGRWFRSGDGLHDTS